MPNLSVTDTSVRMASKRLPISGYPHFTLSSQEDERLHAKFISKLRSAGFKIELDRLVPPEGTDSRFVIRAITAAFLEAKAG